MRERRQTVDITFDGVEVEAYADESVLQAARRAGAPCLIGSMAYDVTPDGSKIRTMMGVDPERVCVTGSIKFDLDLPASAALRLSFLVWVVPLLGLVGGAGAGLVGGLRRLGPGGSVRAGEEWRLCAASSACHRSWFLTGFFAAVFQPRAFQLSIHSVMPCITYFESVCSRTAREPLSALSASMAAISSMRLLVVSGSPPCISLRCGPAISTAPQPPGPGFPLQAPSV